MTSTISPVRGLTKRQVEALATLDSWRRNMEVSTTSLKADGVSLAVLRSLERDDMTTSTKYANGVFWRITDAGRAALASEQPR